MCWYIYLVLGIWFLISLLTHRFLVRNKKNTILKDVPKKFTNVMFVIAHPDDECMFFGPAITSLTNPEGSSSSKKKAKNVYILCLSDGDAAGIGKIRQEEFVKSCKLLGLLDSNILMHSDDPNNYWNTQSIADAIFFYIQKYNINNLITFDQYGISGHPNHQSIYSGMQCLKMDKKRKIAVRFFALESVNLVRKYMGFIDSLFSRNYFICTADWSTRKTIQRAMEAHASQYVWFRRLYITFSRYLFINTFQVIDTET